MPPDPFLEQLLSPDGPDLHFLDERDLGRIEHSISRRELRQKALRAAQALVSRGIGPGERVVVALGNSEAAIVWMLGTLAAGAAAVPLPAPEGWRRGPVLLARLRNVIAACEPAAVVAPPKVTARLRHVEAPFLPPELPADAPLTRDLARHTAYDVAFVQYTAGSTGNPKGVIVTHDNLQSNLEGIGAAVKVRSDDRVLSWLPIHHDMGLVGALMFSLYWRLALFLGRPQAFVLRPSSWLRAISTHRATLSPAPHFAYSLCAHKVPDDALHGVDLRSWRLALDGSEPIRPETVGLFSSRFARFGFSPTAYFPVYGLAEATLAVCTPSVGEAPYLDHVLRSSLTEGMAVSDISGRGRQATFVSVGRALPGHRIEIREPRSHALLGDRQLGELHVSGPSVTPRYHGEPANIFRSVLATGDLGYTAGGRVFIVDRLKDVIIRAGETFYPSDLEMVAERVPGVRRGRVVAFALPPLEQGVERIVVTAEMKKGFRQSQVAQALREAVRDGCDLEIDDVALLPPHSLPLTPSGKLIRHRAREAYFEALGRRRGLRAVVLERLWPHL